LSQEDAAVYIMAAGLFACILLCAWLLALAAGTI
jgi:hypothetical protein